MFNAPLQTQLTANAQNLSILSIPTYQSNSYRMQTLSLPTTAPTHTHYHRLYWSYHYHCFVSNHALSGSKMLLAHSTILILMTHMYYSIHSHRRCRQPVLSINLSCDHSLKQQQPQQQYIQYKTIWHKHVTMVAFRWKPTHCMHLRVGSHRDRTN